MIRDFMPGECSLGPNAAVFSQMDQNPAAVLQNPQLADTAKTICQSCVQLSYCETQREGIVDILSSRGIGRTVVGAEVVARVEPTEPDPMLNEPTLDFDLTDAPYSLPLIRQAWRGRRVPRNARVKHESLIRAHLSEEAANKRPELEAAVRDMIADRVTRAFLIYRYVRLGRDLGRAAALAPLELADASTVQDSLSESVIYFKKAGFARPDRSALLHSPEFFEAFMNRHMGTYGLTRRQIINMFNNYVDPLTAMKEWRLNNRRAREAVNNQEADEATLAPEHSRTIHVRATIREDGLYRYSQALHPYMKRIARKKGANHKDQAQALSKRFRDLRSRHSDVEENALAYIAYFRREDPDGAVQTFREIYAELQMRYAGNPDCSLTQLQNYSFKNATLEEADSAVQNHLQIAEKIRSLATPEQTASANFKEFVYYYTAKCSDIQKITARTIDIEYKKRLLRRSGLRIWLLDKIAGLYETSECKEVAQNVAAFLDRDYLRTALALEDAPPSYSLIDTANGRYLEWSKEFLAFSAQEQEAVLAVFKLDRLILGRAVDTKELERHFQVDNLTYFVTTYLLPHTATPSTLADQFKAGGASLTLRGIRNNVKGGNWKKSAKDGHKDKVDQASSILLSDLAADGVEIASEACMKGIRNLLKQIGRIAPSRLNNRLELLSCTHAYLREAQQIEALDLETGDPYQIALGHSANFCKYFLGFVDKDLTKARAVTILQRPSMQPMVDLRLFQQAVREYEPQFSQRGISRGYCVERAFAYRRSPQFLKNALADYDALRSEFPGISTAALNRFCFKTGKNVDARTEIEDWLTALRQLDHRFKDAVSMEYIEETAIAHRGDQLAKVLTERIRTIDAIMRENEQVPHSAIGRNVVEHAVFRRSNPRQWLKDEYIARWDFVGEREEVGDIGLRILRRLILFDTRKPGNMIKLYRGLSQKYQGDPYITQAMVDEAVYDNPARALSSLSRKRTNLIAEQQQALSERGTASAVNTPSDSPSPEDIVVGKVAEITREQQMIADLLETAPEMEKAAVGVVWDLPWLIPEGLRNQVQGGDLQKLYTHYNVSSLRDLRPIVDTILRRLTNS